MIFLIKRIFADLLWSQGFVKGIFIDEIKRTVKIKWRA